MSDGPDRSTPDFTEVESFKLAETSSSGEQVAEVGCIWDNNQPRVSPGTEWCINGNIFVCQEGGAWVNTNKPC